MVFFSESYIYQDNIPELLCKCRQSMCQYLLDHCVIHQFRHTQPEMLFHFLFSQVYLSGKAKIAQPDQREKEGWNRLKKCAKFTDRFGSIPERVFYDGELLKRPFMTSHACYIWAVNSLLINRDGENLKVLMNLPENWTDVSFENLTTPDGLKVSAKMEGGVITECKIVNINAEKRKIVLVLPGQEKIELLLNNKEKYEK